MLEAAGDAHLVVSASVSAVGLGLTLVAGVEVKRKEFAMKGMTYGKK